jgi:hypothetical protein
MLTLEPTNTVFRLSERSADTMQYQIAADRVSNRVDNFTQPNYIVMAACGI